MVQTVWADTSDTMCEVYKHGDERQNMSAACTFSQRQGYIDIALRNGDTYSLSPGSKADHFKDQNGNKVERSKAGGNSQVYQWENQKIVVTFSDSTTGQFGATPHNLRDLVGARAGQAEGTLKARAYEYRNGAKSGDSDYGNWKERSTGRCVTVRTENGRYQSIIYSSDVDCNASGKHHSGSAASDTATRGGRGDFDARGKIPCAQHAGQPMGQCHFGVSREGGGTATVVVTRMDGRKRAIFFINGKANSADTGQADGCGEFSVKREGDLNLIRVGDERYEIPDAVVYGGWGLSVTWRPAIAICACLLVACAAAADLSDHGGRPAIIFTT